MRRNYLFFRHFDAPRLALPPLLHATRRWFFQALANAGGAVSTGAGDSAREMALTAAAWVAPRIQGSLRHRAAAQCPGAKAGWAKHVTLSQIEAGDLVFYNTERRPYSHVGIFSRRTIASSTHPGRARRVRVGKHARSVLGQAFRRGRDVFPFPE